MTLLDCISVMIQDPVVDLRDGVRFIHLIELLAETTFQKPTSSSRIKLLDSLNAVFNFLRDEAGLQLMCDPPGTSICTCQ